jgi:hypothetical protein
MILHTKFRVDPSRNSECCTKKPILVLADSPLAEFCRRGARHDSRHFVAFRLAAADLSFPIASLSELRDGETEWALLNGTDTVLQ